MRLTVLGATGGIGRLLIPMALDQGHQVTAFARAPEKVTSNGAGVLHSHQDLRVVGGDLYNVRQIADAIRGSDAVLSAFGPTTLRRTHLRRDFGRNLVQALRQTGVARFIHVSSAFCFNEGGLIYAVMTNTLFRNVTQDHRDADNEMAQPDLAWTILRPPRLLDGPAKGKLRIFDGHLAPGMTITRADVAAFMLQEAVTPRHVQQFVGLSS
ncbi:NAD(P)-dependent oxidoreductase [Edaphobacter aggregans]|uniref:NAD(P)-dependent oxidoreductase n=1 Tax=Edaphobacter aggregans TaxID=570835 RepID=UPI000554A19D|nr:NAD(P)-binding oxidoreductase [Edaphobacter aggregans]